MLEGYELKTGKTVTANAVRTRIGWRGGGNRVDGAGRAIRLRIVMRPAKRYSFRFIA